MKSYLKTAITFFCFFTFLVGCSATQRYKKDIDEQVAKNATKIADATGSVKPETMQKANPLVVKLGSVVWLGNNIVPTQKERVLPDVFSKEVTFIFPDKANLSTIAERITHVTGVLVRIMPDVFITADSLNPSGDTTLDTFSNTTTGAITDQNGIPLPVDASSGTGVVGSTVTADGYDLEMKLNYSGPLDGMLDIVSARAGISWEYKNDSIYFYRLVTKTFTLKALPGDINMTTQVGKNSKTSAGIESSGSSVDNNTGSDYSSSSSSGTDIKLSIWDNIESAIKVMLTPLGQVSISQSTGTITVRDTQEVINDVAALIKNENRIATKQVNLKIEVFSVTTDGSNEFGLDWNAVYKNLSDTSWSLAFNSPTSILSEQTAKLGFTILQNGTDSKRWDNSSVFFKALSNVGKASVVTSTSITTTNNQPIPFALTDQTGYLASTEAASAEVGTTGTPGLTPGVVTTGYVMNILPTVLDNSRVLLQLSIGISDLQGLNIVSSGDQSIQTPEISSNEIFQRISLKTDETLVLNAFSRVSGQYDKRGVVEGANAGLGGSFNGRKKRTTVIVLVTPTLLEGA